VDALDTADVPDDRDSSSPWRPAAPIRFAVLLGCLAAALLGLLLTSTDLGRGLGIGSGARATRGAARWCVPSGLPQLAHVDLAQLEALRATLPRVIAPIGGHRYEGGVASPERAWSDNSPVPPRAARVGDGWPGAYEMRWWTRGEADVAADVFAFGDAAQAKSFFARASGVDCHRDGRDSAGYLPADVRNLVWVNPDDVREYDAYLRRGRLVYRIVDVPPTPKAGRSPSPQSLDLYAVDLLACMLPEASCAAAPARPRPHPRDVSVFERLLS